MENEDHRRMEGKPDGCLVQVCTERNVDGSYILGVGWKGRMHGAEDGARIFKLIRSPRIDSKEPTPPGCVSIVGRYDNPIPTRFLAPRDC
jgi:hypothetical protein